MHRNDNSLLFSRPKGTFFQEFLWGAVQRLPFQSRRKPSAVLKKQGNALLRLPGGGEFAERSDDADDHADDHAQNGEGPDVQEARLDMILDVDFGKADAEQGRGDHGADEGGTVAADDHGRRWAGPQRRRPDRCR